MREEMTPTEERILGYMAEGMYDAEIAVRVGLPINEVKARVTRILQREHLLDRAELVAWWERGGQPEVAPLEANDGGVSRRAALMGGVVAVFVAALVAVAMLPGEERPAASGQDVTPLFGDSATQTPTSASQAEAVSAFNGEEPPALDVHPTNLTPGEALIVQRWEGRQTTVSVDRIYLDPTNSARVVEETIWEPPEGFITPFVVPNANGSRLAIGSRPTPDEQGDVRQGDVHSRLIVGSVEGEFDEPVPIQAGYYPVFFGGEQVVLAPTTEAVTRGWQIYDPATGAIEELDPPQGAVRGPVGWTERFGLLWPGEDGTLYDTPGKPLFTIEHNGQAPLRIERLVVAEDDGVRGGGVTGLTGGFALVSWWGDEDSPYTTLLSFSTGEILGTWRGAFRAIGLGFGGTFIGSRCDLVPVLPIPPTPTPGTGCYVVRFSTAGKFLQQFEEPMFGPGAQMTLVGSQRGPFVQVPAAAEECVPLLDRVPEAAANVVYCAEPGELVPLRDVRSISAANAEPRTTTVGGGRYITVVTPDGDEAWVNHDQLEWDWLIRGLVR